MAMAVMMSTKIVMLMMMESSMVKIYAYLVNLGGHQLRSMTGIEMVVMMRRKMLMTMEMGILTKTTPVFEVHLHIW